jgi:hypothetical protein
MTFEKQIPIENEDNFNLEREGMEILSIASEIQNEEAMSLARKLKSHETNFKGAGAVLVFASLAKMLDTISPDTNNFFSQSFEFFGAVPKWTILANLIILTYEGVAADLIKERLSQMTRSLSINTEPHATE